MDHTPTLSPGIHRLLCMDFDVVIIGGSVAGSAAGSMLSREGKKVLILEKDHFPRFHIGESLIPFGNDVLREIGVWEKVEQAGFMTKLGAEFTLTNSHGFTRIWFRNNQVASRGSTFQVERSRFDKLLLDHARDCGCDVREGVAAGDVVFSEDGVEVAFKADSEAKVRASWLIDASGRDTFVGKKLKLDRSDCGMPKKVAVYGHFKGIYRNDGEAAGHITIVRLPRGWFWLIPLDAEKTSVGLVTFVEDLKASGMKPDEYFMEQVRQSPEMLFRMGGEESLQSSMMGGLHVTSDYTYRHRKCCGARWILAGDAAGFIDPVFSSGVMVALKTGVLAARKILAAKDRPFTGSEQNAYTRQVHHMTGVFMNMINMFYDNDAFAVFMNRRPYLGLAAAVNTLVAGRTDHDFMMAMRVRLFYLICRLQRWWQVVPRLSFALPEKR